MKTSSGYATRWPVGLALLAVAACIDVGAIKQRTGSGGTGASGGKGGGTPFDGGPGGTAGAGGNGGQQVSRAGIVLLTDADGNFYTGNAAGVRGGWWSTGDLYGPDNSPGTGDCPTAGFSLDSCSMLTTPTPGMPFRPGPNGMCTEGVAAQVLVGSDGQPAWSSIWGNTIGFTLASDSQSDAGFDSWGTYDAPAHGFAGMAFDIVSVPPVGAGNPAGNMRISFPTKGTELNAAFWQGASADRSPITTAPGHYEIFWPDVGGPSYLKNPPPFDPTKLEAIRFDVVSNAVAKLPYSFCIKNVTLVH